MTQPSIELEITGLTASGDGVGRNHGLALFVPGALPGETVRARIVQQKKNYARAELQEITQAVAGRVAPPCPAFSRCGGCSLQHLAYEEQLCWKQRWLADALTRIGGLAVEVLPTLGAQQTTYYRDRVQFHSAWQKNQLKLGFYQRGSKNVTNASPCVVLRPLLKSVMQSITNLLSQETEQLRDLRQVALRCDHQGQFAMLTLVGPKDQPQLYQLAERLREQEPRLCSIWANWGQEVYGIYGDQWRKLAGLEKLPDSLGGLRLQISPGAFTQINAAQAQQLYERVAAYADLSGTETVLDAYSGVGAIALDLAGKARAIVGVEEYAPAVADARANAALNGLHNCRFVAGQVEEALPLLLAEGLQAQVAVLDPPRAGCAAAALQAVAKLKPRRIVYVSCNPATLARDARLLTELGYAASMAQPLDMFPYTGHVESVLLLQRQNIC